jgi:outer membrane lipoprotein carrier protein
VRSILTAVALIWRTLTPALDSINAIARAIQTHYAHARTLKAIFYERYSDGAGGESSESGTVYFSRPGRMRWDYESPEKKLFLVDGQNVWFYVPADHTVSRAKLKESSDWRTPLALLTGKADLAKLCSKVELLQPVPVPAAASGPHPAAQAQLLDPNDSLLRCTPRGEPAGGDTAVFLETNPAGDLTRLTIREPGNAETEFRFGNWEQNIAIPESQFHFQPPPGVSVVDEESLAGEVH